MAKIVVCGKKEDFETILTEIAREFSDIKVEYLLECDDKQFIGIFREDSTEPSVIFYGNPKFDALMESVRIFHKGSIDVSKRILDFIDMIDKDTIIKVFVTQSCGWCFPAVVKAVSFAYLSPKIRVEVFDCYSFPKIATQYNVITVPKTVINDRVEFIGTKDDNEFFGYIIKALKE